MANKELAPLMVEKNFISKVNAIASKLEAISRTETRTTFVSDITNDLGDIRAGRFIALSTGQEPTDSDANGVVMDAGGQLFGSESYHLFGVNGGTLMFGIKADTGEAVFLGGNAVLNSDGLDVTDTLKWIIRQTATNTAYTREAKIGMSVPEGLDVPALQLSLTSPGASELMSNGGFEDGDFTNWTKTTETNGAWEIDSAVKQAGSYSVKWVPSALGWGVKSLLHFDGTDASITMTDATGRVWTARGNAQLDTAQKVFGTASLLLDGTGDYIDTPDSDDFNVGSGDFEIECRIRINTLKVGFVYGQANATLSSQGNYFLIGSPGSATIRFTDSSGNAHDLKIPESTFAEDTWYTISFSRFSDLLCVRVDGTLIDSLNITGFTANNSTGKFSIGRYGDYNDFYFDGWIDEFIFKKGGVIHTEDYTPALAAYDISATSGVLTNDRIEVTAANQYTISGYLRRDTGTTGTVKAEAKWYDDASAGSLIQTDIIGTLTSSGSFVEFSQTLEAPATAESVAIVLISDEAESSEVNFDTLSVQEVSVNTRLQLRDDGVYVNGVEVGGGISYPTQSDMFFDCVLFVPSSGAATTPIVTYDGSQMYDWLLDGQTDADNNGNQYYFNVLLAAGTYTLNTLGYANSASPITKVYIDSSLVATFDWYSGSATNNVVKSQTGITVATSGLHEIKFVIDGKNASANTNYRWRVTKAMIWKTA